MSKFLMTTTTTPTPTNSSSTTNKIVRIQKDEKQLLAHLREVYGNDYKKYFECIRRGSNIPLTIRRIYKLLDERKAYRRISDYFHRERIAKREKRSKHHHFDRSHHRSSTRHSGNLSRSMSVTHMDQEMYDEDNPVHQPSMNSSITNNSGELSEANHRMDDGDDEEEEDEEDEDDVQDIQSLSTLNFSQSKKQKLSLLNDRQSYSQPNLLSIREHIQKALRELDQAIVSKTDSILEENDDEQSKSVVSKPTEQCYTKLDDLVRSLSSVVNQQQENVRFILNESSVLLLDDTIPSEKLSSETQESIKHILERLNKLIDRGHTVYDRIENILSEF